MDKIIQQQEITDNTTTEQTDNDVLKELDEYLNSNLETDREDYNEINVWDLPDPVLQENGMWKIPGTTKEYKTPIAARLAKERYSKYQIQNQASMLMYGITYNSYINGDDGTTTNNQETGTSEKNTNIDSGQSNTEPIKRTNEPVPETPADYTTIS